VLDTFEDLEAIRHVEGLESQREWSVIAANSFNWCLEVKEAFFLNFSSQLCSKTASDRCFVSY
jgi:hypothetical protein